jgi:hypothetical protein
MIVTQNSKIARQAKRVKNVGNKLMALKTDKQIQRAIKCVQVIGREIGIKCELLKKNTKSILISQLVELETPTEVDQKVPDEVIEINDLNIETTEA